ncbi:uncharacterized protein Z519_04618 [Cladophialophora bantiana CBS 173.52]|uniref:Heterokaryon incompatibility domain-containing protein n=1 Tax=Cladophialophora bantiana (strain ATCC 10958 / CBS 173.52 / CDC B-1940 / NIH 8579) TaxID=1442370 RepID=A0A0D2G7N3_CLAB1|nr:uncharacterized protein Z519_04618 [Cladophialophora bantiana CBS 173.52]KIW94642.1 hypothetical protein Z519_04618 [Cladophialophora bantiana CBS 173.52]
MNTLSIAVEEAAPNYVYKKLQNKDDIRLVTILPGRFEDIILLEISHVPLPPLHPTVSRRMALAELKKTLPPNWDVHEARASYRFLFSYKNPETGTRISSWTHPIDTIDPSLYLQPNEGRENYEPKYEALSYTWGSPLHPETAYIATGTSSSKLSIRKNLASAIRHLRYPDKLRTIWIDALCINQSDVNERNEHVPRMVDIYPRAQRVVAWLGPDSANGSNAMRALDFLGSQTLTTVDNLVIATPTATERHWNRRTVLPYDRGTWVDITQVLNRDYFKRLWVIQEIQLAKEVILCCGNSFVSWDRFCNAVNFLYTSEHLSQSLIPRMRLRLVKRLAQMGSNYPISWNLLNLVDGRGCSDQRDLIYGLLGLLPASFSSRIEPRYDLPVGHAYKEVMLAHIEHAQRLDFFEACTLARREQPGTPSWVPDFSAPPVVGREVGMQLAAGYSRCWAECRWEEQLQQDVLKVAGVQCARITHVTKLIPVSDNLLETLADVRALEPDDLDTAPLYVTGEPFRVAYAKTVAGNHVRERFPTLKFPDLETWLTQDSPNALFGKSGKRGLPSPEAWDSHTKVPIVFSEERALRLFQGRRYFITDRGYIGLGPAGCEVGDITCVFLGYDAPVLLRPQSGNPKTFALVGDAFVYGLHDATALLGQLPSPWRVQVFEDDAGYLTAYRFFNPQSNVLSDEDPRLGPLEQWTRVTSLPRTMDDPVIFQVFQHNQTGEIIKHDPRLDPEALIARGLNVNTFCLV